MISTPTDADPTGDITDADRATAPRPAQVAPETPSVSAPRPIDIAAFYASLASGERRRALIIALLGVTLIPAFGVLDAMAYPDELRVLLIIRFSISAICLLLIPVVLTAKSYWRVTAATITGVIVVGAGIALMTLVTGGDTPFYAGISLSFVGAAVFLTWPLPVTIVVFSVVLAVYFVPMIWIETVTVPGVVTNGFFLVSTAVICLVGMQYRYRLAFQEFLATRDLATSNRELQRLHEHKNRVFHNISHEFRTPLNLILAPVASLLDTDEVASSDTARERCETIRANALRLLGLINDLLDLARLEDSQTGPAVRPVAVAPLLAEIGREAQALAERREIDLVIDIADDLGAWRLDPRYLEKIALNLLSNALKFCEAGDQVSLRASSGDRGLLIEVADTGPGIPPSVQDRIFDRFQQADSTSTRHHGGSGLGLALVREFTETLGGQVRLTSDVGAGCVFQIRFPDALRSAMPPPAADDDALTSSAPAADELARIAAFTALDHRQAERRVWHSGTRGPHVLIAEDDPGLAAEIAGALGSGYRVTGVPDGVEALNQARRHTPHLIISDIMMPEMDGITLCQELRQDPGFKDVPIVLLSAQGSVDSRVSGRSAGADAYLTKPFEPRELRAAVDGLLRSRMRTVGAYLLFEKLGTGGQGEVYRAEHMETGELAAVKLVSPGSSTSSRENAAKRLRREADVLQRLDHPNVVRVIAHGEHDGGHFLALELLQGVTLRRLLRRRRNLSAAAIADIGCGLADALCAVHDAGIVHRDVKCGNVMLVRRGDTLRERVRLFDFGLVRDADLTQITRAGGLTGTLAYLAPELISGGVATAASDIYAAGIVLYTLATGSPPFRGDSRAAVCAAITNAPLPHLRARRPDLPEDLDDIAARCMARDPDERWPSAASLRDALDACYRRTLR